MPDLWWRYSWKFIATTRFRRATLQICAGRIIMFWRHACYYVLCVYHCVVMYMQHVRGLRVLCCTINLTWLDFDLLICQPLFCRIYHRLCNCWYTIVRVYSDDIMDLTPWTKMMIMFDDGHDFWIFNIIPAFAESRGAVLFIFFGFGIILIHKFGWEI